MTTKGKRPLRAVTQDDGAVALYRVMRDREDFGETAQAVFEVVRYAITEFPG
jgi:hypothetical protein